MVDAEIAQVDRINARDSFQKNPLYDRGGRILGMLHFDPVFFFERIDDERPTSRIRMAPENDFSFLLGGFYEILIFIL